MKREIGYGELVQVNSSHSGKILPGDVGSVCGIYEVTEPRIATLRGCEVGDVYYLVETGDGTTEEIHEKHISKD